MYPSIHILLILVWFIVVVILLTILWRVAASLDLVSRYLSEIARDIKKLADKTDK